MNASICHATILDHITEQILQIIYHCVAALAPLDACSRNPGVCGNGTCTSAGHSLRCICPSGFDYNPSVKQCQGNTIQRCRFSDFSQNSDFFRRSDFFSPPFFFFFFLCVCACIVCVTTMRVNWWLSGQFWLRKSSSLKGPLPPWTPTGRCPQTPHTFPLFWTVLVASRTIGSRTTAHWGQFPTGIKNKAKILPTRTTTNQ